MNSSGTFRKTNPSYPTLSLCMIVKNEAHWMPRCLESAKGVVDEIIVVDTGSEDGTPEIAREYRAAVYSYEWRDDFASARNFSLQHASGDWVLVLDADEEIEEASRGSIRDLVATTTADGLKIRQRSLLPPGDLQRHEDLYITRLFRNHRGYRFERPIHEQILSSIERQGGKVLTSDLTILHYGYAQPTAQGQESRAKRNLVILEKALQEEPEDPYLYFQLGCTYKSLGDQTRAYGCFQRVLELNYTSLGDEILDRLFMKLAQLALASDDHRKAVGYALASLRGNPDNVISMYLAALGYMFSGDVQRAYPLFLQIRRHPNASLSDVNELDAVLNYCRGVLSTREAHGD